MAHDVFISYSSRDKPIADAVCANLEAVGVRCWFAPRDIAPGEDWPAAITKAITQSRVMVLVFSPNSNSSEDVSRELFLAANNKLVIIPFKIENIEPEPGKQYYLARTHWLDAINPPTQEQIRSLIDCVKALIPAREPARIVEGQPTVSPDGRQSILFRDSPGHESAERKKIFPVRLLWTGGILLLVLCLAGLFGLAVFTHIISFPLAASAPTATISRTAPIARTPTIAKTSAIAKTPSHVPALQASATTQISRSWNLNLVDDFSSNIHNWPSWIDVTDNCSNSDLQLQNGGLFWKVEGLDHNSCAYFANPTEAAPVRDFDVSVDMQPSTGSIQGDGGIVFRAGDVDDFYLFAVNDAIKSYSIRVNQSSYPITLKDWMMDQAIRPGQVNRLTVSGRGYHFTFTINGKQVADLDDHSISSGYVGLGIDIYDGASISLTYNNFELHGNY